MAEENLVFYDVIEGDVPEPVSITDLPDEVLRTMADLDFPAAAHELERRGQEGTLTERVIPLEEVFHHRRGNDALE